MGYRILTADAALASRVWPNRNAAASGSLKPPIGSVRTSEQVRLSDSFTERALIADWPFTEAQY
jgi:hypothetical protein